MRWWSFIFQSFSFSGALMEALRTVMVFTVAVGVAKTINFSYTITLSTSSIRVGLRPTVLSSSFCTTINKNLIVMQKLEARTVSLKPT